MTQAEISVTHLLSHRQITMTQARDSVTQAEITVTQAESCQELLGHRQRLLSHRQILLSHRQRLLSPFIASAFILYTPKQSPGNHSVITNSPCNCNTKLETLRVTAQLLMSRVPSCPLSPPPHPVLLLRCGWCRGLVI